MTVRANMCMDFGVIEVADYKSDIKFNLRFLRLFGGHHSLRGHQNCFRGNMHEYDKAIEVIDFNFKIKFKTQIITIARESMDSFKSNPEETVKGAW